jgi:hypothetical protein
MRYRVSAWTIRLWRSPMLPRSVGRVIVGKEAVKQPPSESEGPGGHVSGHGSVVLVCQGPSASGDSVVWTAGQRRRLSLQSTPKDSILSLIIEGWSRLGKQHRLSRRPNKDCPGLTAISVLVSDWSMGPDLFRAINIARSQLAELAGRIAVSRCSRTMRSRLEWVSPVWLISSSAVLKTPVSSTKNLFAGVPSPSR